MKRFFCAAKFLAVAAFTVILFASCAEQSDTCAFNAMNTFMTVRSYGKNAHKANLAVKERIAQLENHISTTIEKSDIYRINHAEGKEITAGEDAFFLLDFSLKIAEKTGGALNPALFSVISAWGFTTGNYRVPSEEEIAELLLHVDFRKIRAEKENSGTCVVNAEKGMMLDFGAIGKGFAGDEAVSILRGYGIESAILDLGGNIQVVGKNPEGKDWYVGIKNPWGGSAVCGVKINDQTVITSGGYERNFTADDGNTYIHIFDGKTGKSVENEIASVTIVCEKGLYGDALSTALFVMGTEKAIDFWKANCDFDFIIMTAEKDFIYSEGLEQRITVLEDMNVRCVEKAQVL